MGYRNRNRNSYMRSKAGRTALNDLYKSYPKLKKNKVFHEFLSRAYGHPDELTAIIRESYDEPSMNDYGVYDDSIWRFMEEYGPITLANSDVDGSDKVIGGKYLDTDMSSDDEYNNMYALLGQMLQEGTGSDAWDFMTDSRGDAYSNTLSPEGELTDTYWNKLNDLEDLFEDVGAYGDFLNNRNKTAKERLGDRWKARWQDLLGDSIDIDSTGDAKGADGLEGTKDDRGTATRGDKIDDEYDEEDDEGDDEDENVLSDATQKNILSALLQHSL